MEDYDRDNNEYSIIKINELKKEYKIDYIILMLNFNLRITNKIFECIQNLSKIFTKEKFFNNSCFVFTHYFRRNNERRKEETNNYLITLLKE